MEVLSQNPKNSKESYNLRHGIKNVLTICLLGFGSLSTGGCAGRVDEVIKAAGVNEELLSDPDLQTLAENGGSPEQIREAYNLKVNPSHNPPNQWQSQMPGLTESQAEPQPTEESTEQSSAFYALKQTIQPGVFTFLSPEYIVVAGQDPNNPKANNFGEKIKTSLEMMNVNIEPTQEIFYAVPNSSDGTYKIFRTKSTYPFFSAYVNDQIYLATDREELTAYLDSLGIKYDTEGKP